jgi:hypothetical protein
MPQWFSMTNIPSRAQQEMLLAERRELLMIVSEVVAVGVHVEEKAQSDTVRHQG